MTNTMVPNQSATYAYDGLRRLTSMTSAAGNQAHRYDGFGNLTHKTGARAVFTAIADPLTNRLVGSGICYDANGNMLSRSQGCNTPENVYDVSNRLVQAASTGGSSERYLYTSDNKRVSIIKPNDGSISQAFYVYGAKGEIVAIGSTPVLRKRTCDQACGEGDSNTWPYGDQVTDALDIFDGWSFEQNVAKGTCRW